MMDKIILFGSFSEDETLAFQAPTPAAKPVPKPVPKPVETTETVEKKTPAETTKPVVRPAAPSNGLKSNGNVPPSLSSPKGVLHAVTPIRTVANQLERTSLSSEKHRDRHADTSKTVAKSWAALVQPAATSFLPRGLVNTGNTCFLNSTLQALLSCSPFRELLVKLKAQEVSQEGFPLLYAFVCFVNELEKTSFPEVTSEKHYRKGEQEKPASNKDVATKDIQIGMALTPSMFDPILVGFNPQQPPSGCPRNRQEDAQEFLSFLMNQMHDELVKLDGRHQPAVNVAHEEWETVGPKNRTAFTRTYSDSESLLSEIFRGQQHSSVKVKGARPTVTVEPFYLLHLDISSDAVHSVEDALKFYAAPETLEGYKSAAGKTEDASRFVKILSLPKVLILHLMRFGYSGGTWKLHKGIKFPAQLILGRELLTSSSEARKYELVATITHHGLDPSTGHYTADTKHGNAWLRFDDRNVTPVNLNSVLHDQAYVLFYRRLL